MISKTTVPAQPTLLRGLSEEEVRLRRARGQGNTVKLPTSRSYAQILRENIVTLINLILFALSAPLCASPCSHVPRLQ